MKANKLILFIISAVFFASCENELNLEPKQREDASVTLSTESGVTNVLTGAYALAANGNAYGGRILLYADLLGVSGVLSTTDLRWRGSFGELRQMYIKSMLANNVIIEGTYSRFYQIINASNTESLKLYTIYSPPEHMDGIVKKTKQEAESQEEHFDGKTTE